VVILCTLVENGKMRHVETIPRMGGMGRKGIKENNGESEFSYGT
jgi:hypothetical protein